jgi:hypothetical protein
MSAILGGTKIANRRFADFGQSARDGRLNQQQEKKIKYMHLIAHYSILIPKTRKKSVENTHFLNVQILATNDIHHHAENVHPEIAS